MSHTAFDAAAAATVAREEDMSETRMLQAVDGFTYARAVQLLE